MRKVIEAALAHVVDNQTEAAYTRSDPIGRRQSLMDDWAAYLDGEPGSRVSRPPPLTGTPTTGWPSGVVGQQRRELDYSPAGRRRAQAVPRMPT